MPTGPEIHVGDIVERESAVVPQIVAVKPHPAFANYFTAASEMRNQRRLTLTGR
ncbi:MAG TPA: hypothetical protein VGP17_12050 [Solirubrobacteraceae bacterium]|nr:hypothetical protein [Solirubrobacteraceae bacterium]